MDDDIIRYNQAALQNLERAMALQQQRFALILARCNYQRLQSILIHHLSQQHPDVQVLSLPQRIPSLLEAIQIHLKLNPADTPAPTALMLTGLGQVSNLLEVLTAANLARDTYREQLHFPLVLWIDDSVLAQLTERAQDLKNLGPPTIRFEFPPAELIAGLHREANALFNRLLQIPSGLSLSDPLIDLSNRARLSNELTCALADLQKADCPLSPDLQASLQFARARQAHSQLDLARAKDLYEHSLAYWQNQPSQPGNSPTPLEKQALLQFHLGLWWRGSATLQRATYQAALQQARHWFEAALLSFNQTGRSELVARFIHPLCEVLQKQQDWLTLAALTQEALALHEQTQDLVRQARDHGFLAEIALQQQDWPTAQAEALRALDRLAVAEAQLQENASQGTLATALTLARRFQKSWYRFLLGEAQMHLHQPQNAIALLEQARREANPEADLILYLQILQKLSHHYFQLGEYRRAFDVKLERRQVEYSHNLRAFIGAGAVQLHQPTAVARDLSEQTRTTVSAEIAASGRQQDVEALIARLQQQRCTLIVIHGPSGVGKSSILNAGLAPAIRRLTPEGRTSLPILVQTYGSWPQTIQAALAEALPHNSQLPPPGEDAASLLTTLHQATDRQRFIVLLFDQFEEFFFDRDPADRQVFYHFLEGCLNLPWVKVVLTLRQDYLHHLLDLESDTHITAPGAVLQDGGVLSNDVRYPLGNFSPPAAEAVIRRLTEAAQYYLEDPLIHRLVEDLAESSGDVRPIELQVVGAQLQREGITTLAQYEALGSYPKLSLVQRFLAHVVEDCGEPNQKLSRLVLYLLTEEDDDNRLYRPLKTREDIEDELSLLGVEFIEPQLDLVLYILVGSGLVFEIPEAAEARYQLVHDYLMPFVREEQISEILIQLSDSKKQQEDTESQQFLEILAKNKELEHRVTLQETTIGMLIGGLIMAGVFGIAVFCSSRWPVFLSDRD